MKKKNIAVVLIIVVFTFVLGHGIYIKNSSDKSVPDVSVSAENIPDEIIIYDGKEYKKSELCNATLQWLELSEQERLFSSYLPPEFLIIDEKWGVQFEIKNLTPTGATIVCTQSGGQPTGELNTGSWFIIENWTQENGWKEVEYVLQGDFAWTQEAWMIAAESTSEWDINWEWLYGKLVPGKYRIGKEVMDFRAAGDYDTAIYFIDFNIN